MSPIRQLADTSRQLPLRNISKLILDTREGKETLAMIGIRKPSLHYYSRQIVFYEPNTQDPKPQPNPFACTDGPT